MCEARPETATAPLGNVNAVEVKYVQDTFENIDSQARSLEFILRKGRRQAVDYE